MDKPKIGKRYIFVRVRGGRIEHTEFVRYEDGSAGFEADGAYHIHECHPQAWQGALQALAELGFVESRAAREQGIISSDWQPPSELPRA